jgi:hypothetical protein
MIIASHNCKLLFLKTSGATADGDVDLFGVGWESHIVWLLNNGDKPATFLTVSTGQMHWTGTYTTSVSDFDGGTFKFSLYSALKIEKRSIFLPVTVQNVYHVPMFLHRQMETSMQRRMLQTLACLLCGKTTETPDLQQPLQLLPT